MNKDAPNYDKKKLLFVVNEAGEFVELKRVALAAKLQGYEIIFLFAQPGYINLNRDRYFCQVNGFKDYFPGKKTTKSSNEKLYQQKAEMLQDGYVPHSFLEGRTSLLHIGRIATIVLALITIPALIFISLIAVRVDAGDKVRKSGSFRYIKSLLFAKTVLDKTRPDLIIFGQEFPGSPNALLTKLCSKYGTPTLIIPFAVGTTREMVESLGDKSDYEVGSSLLNRMAAYLFPHWVNYYAGKRLLRLPGKTIIILEVLGLAPEHPWLPNNSRATRIAVESPEMMRYHSRMRFPESQLRLTGAAYDDVLAGAAQSAQVQKQKLCRRLHINSEKPLLVCAWPTNQFGSRFTLLEFNNYEQLCQAWARALSSVAEHTEFNIVIRPHPVTDPEFLIRILKPYQLHKNITDIDTLELVPFSDLFVACVSSTLRWAIACGIPAVNYDCYTYGYTDFDSAKGVSTVQRYADFELVLKHLTENPEAYAEARSLQAECSADWGIHDGRSMERILKLIGELIDNSAISIAIPEITINKS